MNEFLNEELARQQQTLADAQRDLDAAEARYAQAKYDLDEARFRFVVVQVLLPSFLDTYRVQIVGDELAIAVLVAPTEGATVFDPGVIRLDTCMQVSLDHKGRLYELLHLNSIYEAQQELWRLIEACKNGTWTDYL